MDLERTSGRVTENLLTWLETDDSVKQNPDIMRLKGVLVEKLAARKRRMSSVSESTTSSCLKHPHKFVACTPGSQLDSDPDKGDSSKIEVNMIRYKTELCRSFSENGYCRYGDKCQFAHGFVEVRQTARHPRYKTEPCKAYHLSGFCPYGARCNFVHNDLEHLNQTDTRSTRQRTDSSVTFSALMNRTLLQLNRRSSTDMLWPSRHVLGSTADSPPQSITDSPSPSPTAMLFETAFDSLPSFWTAAIGQK